MEIAGNELKTYALDHHGLVASICKDLKVMEKIDARMNKKDPRRIVSTGMATVAMILYCSEMKMLVFLSSIP